MDTEAPTIKSKIKSAIFTKKPRGFKIALLILLALFVLFVCTIFFLPSFLPIGTIRSVAKTKAREFANLDVDFQNLRFGWNGDVVLDNISVAPVLPDGSTGETLLTVNEVRTNVALTPLLSGKAIVNAIDVDGFNLTLHRDADGNLNLPDLSELADKMAAAPASARPPALLMSIAAAGEQHIPLPPIELHRLEVKNGRLSFQDDMQDLNLDVALDFMHLEGKTLNDPFSFNGRVVPYPEAPNLGELPFSGHVAMVRDNEFNPDGEAGLEVDVKALSLHEMADKFGLGHLLTSARLDGTLRAGYAGRKAALHIPQMHLSQANLGLPDGGVLDVPDTTTSFNADFDPDANQVNLTDISLTNDIAAIRARGIVDGVTNLVHGVLPDVDLDFSGTADFAGASHYVSTRELGLQGLPELDGKTSFAGKASLPANHMGEPPSPAFSLDFSDGSIQALESNTGMLASIDLDGVAVRAAAVLGDEIEVNSHIALANVPGRAFIPDVSHDPVKFSVNGGAALQYSSETAAVEIRLDNTRAELPATPWSTAATLHNPEARLTFDLTQDQLHIESIHAIINEVIEGRVSKSSVSGIMAGQPTGQVGMQVSTLLDHLKEFVGPMFPEQLVPHLSGALVGSSLITFNGDVAEASVKGELDNSRALLNIIPNQMEAEVQTPKAELAMLASLNVNTPTQIAIHSLEARGDSGLLRYSDRDGNNASGQIGNSQVKATGTIDAEAGQGAFSALSFDVNGMNLALGKGGEQLASLASGLAKIVAASPERPMAFPLGSQGDFALPDLNLGVDNLLFHFKDEPSDFGNVRAKVSIDGYIGSDKRQLINLRAAQLQAAPIAVNSRGQFDLGTNALLAEYATRVAPSGISSLLGYLGLPPTLLADAAATGTLSYSDNQVNSKGAAQGQLRATDGKIYPFQAAHDFSAAFDSAASTLALDVRRLDGTVKTAAGEAVATLQAQKSRLHLSRAGAKGLLDVRVNGSAAPTRHLVLGLTGVVPQLAELSNVLHNARADGVYQGWLQLRDNDAATLTLNTGGVWQGAALAIGGVPFLAEAAKLSAAVEGELSFTDRRLTLSRMMFRSDSGMMQADGTAAATYTVDQDSIPTGVSDVAVNLRFVMADLAKSALTFPGLIPAETALSGRVDGTFQAGGNANNIQVNEGVVRFQGFRATPAPGVEVTIPDGNASFGATIDLRTDGPRTGSPFDFIHMINIRNGSGSLTGLQVRNQSLDDLSAAFQLENGVLTLQHARVNGLGAQMEAAGHLDFNSPDPAALIPLANVDLKARFALADLAGIAGMLPGIVPPQMQLAGRVEGQFDAGGNARNIRVNQGVVHFQNFQAVPAEGLEIAIPNGQAQFGATVDLHFHGQKTGSPFDVMHMLNVHDGAGALSGLQIRGQNIQELSTAFQLENGVFTLHHARLNGLGAVGEANGRLDFNGNQNALIPLAHVDLNTRFAIADLSHAASLIPSLIPPQMGLAGKVEGVLSASGNANAVRVTQGAVQFQGFQVKPVSTLEVAIPSGQAQFGALLDLHFNGTPSGSAWDIFRMFNIHEGKAAVTGAAVRGTHVSDMNTEFQLENGVVTLHHATLNIGGGAEGHIAINGQIDFNGHLPSVNTQLAIRNIPLSEFNDEIKDFMSFEVGQLNIPATHGQSAGVAFVGDTEDQILRSLRLHNFTFATGPVKLHTGPVLNTELDKARTLMRQKITDGKSREITFERVDGSAQANGDGIIRIPTDHPINLIGDNTGDFRAQGVVTSNHEIEMRVMVAGKLERIIGFTLPNLIPNLRSQGNDAHSNFMEHMNRKAAQGHYGVNVTGSLEKPDISGIGQLVAAFMADIVGAVPEQILGGVLNLGKDAPGALMDAGKAVLQEFKNPGEALKNAPENILRSPENVVKGLGQMFGVSRGRGSQQQEEEEQNDEQQQQQQQQQERRGFRLPFGIN